MYRKITRFLESWKESEHRKPLILQGARQVGKTYSILEFGRTHYENVAYFNFETDPKLNDTFAESISPDYLIPILSHIAGISIVREKTLIVFDEVQLCERALTSLKYFCEDAPAYHIIVAGSLLGVAVNRSNFSFPVGKVDSMELYPLSFPEFLEATGNAALLKLLREKDFGMAAAFKDKYTDLLKLYYYVGGMPAAVKAYAEGGSLQNVRRIQQRLISDYEQDFSKHAPSAVIPRIQMVWDGIPSQLAKENKKFIYSVLREGARAKDFELAIQWLLDCGLCHKVGRVTKGGLPLKAYQDLPAFKLYLLDVGLLAAMTDLDARTLLQANSIFTEFKGALTEQYVCQQLCAALDAKPYYWSAESSSGEVDFVLQHNGQVIPLEVKAEENLNAKSLKSFVNTYHLAYGVRTSMSDYREQEKLLNLPLYAISQLWEVCGAFPAQEA